HRRTNRRLPNAAPIGEHDVDRATRLRVEVELQEVERLLGLRAGEAEVPRVVAARLRPEEPDRDERDHPEGQHPPALLVAVPRDLLEHCETPRVSRCPTRLSPGVGSWPPWQSSRSSM